MRCTSRLRNIFRQRDTRFARLLLVLHATVRLTQLPQPWPIVERFLQSQSPGAVGLDVGCGNGKYLPVNKSVYIVASDRYVHLFLTFIESVLIRVIYLHRFFLSRQ